MLEKVKVTSTEIDELVSVIKEVWPEVFVPIIGQAQVDYMLATYQSKQQIEKEVAEGVQYFLLKEQGQTVGYTAYEVIASKIYLSKLYLMNQFRGKGLTSALFSGTKLSLENKESKRFFYVSIKAMLKPSPFTFIKVLKWLVN